VSLQSSDAFGGLLHAAAVQLIAIEAERRRFGTFDAGAMAGMKESVLVAGCYPHELLCAIA